VKYAIFSVSNEIITSVVFCVCFPADTPGPTRGMFNGDSSNGEGCSVAGAGGSQAYDAKAAAKGGGHASSSKGLYRPSKGDSKAAPKAAEGSPYKKANKEKPALLSDFSKKTNSAFMSSVTQHPTPPVAPQKSKHISAPLEEGHGSSFTASADVKHSMGPPTPELATPPVAERRMGMGGGQTSQTTQLVECLPDTYIQQLQARIAQFEAHLSQLQLNSTDEIAEVCAVETAWHDLISLVETINSNVEAIIKQELNIAERGEELMVLFRRGFWAFAQLQRIHRAVSHLPELNRTSLKVH
jgi:hypothetical protein